jgi:hypothetical protein
MWPHQYSAAPVAISAAPPAIPTIAIVFARSPARILAGS